MFQILTDIQSLKFQGRLNLSIDDSWDPKRTPSISPYIETVFISGVINGYGYLIEDLFKAVQAKPNAILIEINSVGGDVDGLLNAMNVIKKISASTPVYAYIHTAYSAALILATAANKIFASSTSTLGGVGVLMNTASSTQENDEVVKTENSKNKNLFNSSRVKGIILEIEDAIIAQIKNNRNFTDESFIEAWGYGDIFGAKEALNNKAVDEVCELYDAVQKIHDDLSLPEVGYINIHGNQKTTPPSNNGNKTAKSDIKQDKSAQTVSAKDKDSILKVAKGKINSSDIFTLESKIEQLFIRASTQHWTVDQFDGEANYLIDEEVTHSEKINQINKIGEAFCNATDSPQIKAQIQSLITRASNNNWTPNQFKAEGQHYINNLDQNQEYKQSTDENNSTTNKINKEDQQRYNTIKNDNPELSHDEIVEILTR